MRRATWVGLAIAAVAGGRAGGQSVQDGREALRGGDYAAAIRVLSRVPTSDTAWATAQRALVGALTTVGRYPEAEDAARRAVASPAATPSGRPLWNTLGEVLQARGKITEAESAFRRALGERGPDSLTGAVHLAVLHYERGDVDLAMKEFDRFIDVYNRGGARSADDLVAVATACRYLGRNDPALFKDALKAFDKAIAVGGEDMTPQIELGELFLEKYNGADAQKQFEEALGVNPSNPRALLGAARRLSFDGGPGVDSLLDRALAVNPNYADAHVFKAQEYLDLEEYPNARREIDRALQVDPASLDALAVLAAVHRLEGDVPGFEDAKRRALALNPRDAELFNTVAELTARVRQYAEAADLAKQAIALDAKSWRGYGLLGMNQLRMGQIAEGRKNLDVAFKGDPYDVWIKNTLDLLDTYPTYAQRRTDHFVFMIEKSESDLLGIYLDDLAERAYATFAARYAYTPPLPIRIEVYRSHADFSVRTIGLAGLGALGVSFGSTLAFDSPAAKDAGPFNWGSTVWHELAHTFTLGLTDHRVPRWLSEGVSVFEEHRAIPGWGFGPTPEFLTAFASGKLVPVSRMNDGFMHPAYPEQVQFSYYQASLVCELVERDWGDKALLRMLEGYKAGLTTDQVFQRVLRTDAKAFDAKFDGFLRQRFATTLAALKEFGARMSEGVALYKQGKLDEAIGPLERARAIFPEYGGEENPYWYLAMVWKAKGDPRKAADALGQMVVRGETNYPAHIELAALLEGLGDRAGAALALERALYINPFDPVVHQRLATLYDAVGDRRKVIRERLAIVATNPVDRPEALYQLALAYHAAGDEGAARRAVVRALEDAPNFAAAQTLLLTLHEHGPPPARESKP